MKKIFVVIGRFQPLHNGHAAMINKAISAANAEEDAEVLILIGSANKSRSIDNPFTYEERREVLVNHLISDKDSLMSINKPVDIYPLPDFDYQEDVWEEYLHNTISKFAKKSLKERYYIPVFVSAERGNDSELRSSWKSGGDTFFVPPARTFFGRELSATMVRDHLVNIPVDKVLEDEGLLEYLPLYSRDFINKRPDLHQKMIDDRKAIKKYKDMWAGAPYTPIFQATDAFVIDKNGRVLLIRRGGEIGEGSLAMAGGYLEPELTLEQNMKKELLEETNLDLDEHSHEIVGSWVCDTPNRSKRGRIITTAFMVKLSDKTLDSLLEDGMIKAGDDAAEICLFDIDSIKKGRLTLYSDHAGIINKLCELNNY